MAQAQVTLKVAPLELQIIREALMDYLNGLQYFKKDEARPAVTVKLDEDYRRLMLLTDKLLQDIGMS